MLILAHALAGSAALVLGLVALRARKRRGRHTRAGEVYFWVMVPLLVTGGIAGARTPGLSPFEIAIIPTGGPLLLGYWAGKRRPENFLGERWLTWHISGMAGSFIGVVTAGAFQTVYRFLPDHPVTLTATFALPAIVGTYLISRTIARRSQSAALSRPMASIVAGSTPRSTAR